MIMRGQDKGSLPPFPSLAGLFGASLYAVIAQMISGHTAVLMPKARGKSGLPITAYRLLE